MARPERNKVDYFPHPVTHGKKMSYLEKKYKNDGYAVWFKILEELGGTDFHYLDLSDEVQIMFLSDRCLVSEKTLLDIINDLVRLKEFDKVLWEENQIIFNEKFVESVKDAYRKRSNNCIDTKSLFLLLEGLGIRKPQKRSRKPQKGSLDGAVKPQRIEEDRIEEERERKKEARAIPFLKQNYPSRWETDFLIKHASKIKNRNKFAEDFNDTVDQENLEFTDRILFARLGKYARNWIENQNKYGGNEENKQTSIIPIG